MTAAARPLAGRSAPRAVALPAALAAATVAARVAYPLVHGQARHTLTVVTVVLFAAASLSSAALRRGARAAVAVLVVAGGGGLVVEALGTAVGVPFGAYTYTGTLGWRLLGVPVVIPLAWVMMAYPALLVGRRIAAGLTWPAWAGVVAAGAALATWDLFLDPQMVAAGHWAWAATQGPTLLGIPLSNFAGWLVTATAMMAALWRLVPDDPVAGGRGDLVPTALYAWTYGGSVVAHAVFLGTPKVALVGGIGMGAVVALWIAAAARRPPSPALGAPRRAAGEGHR